MCCTEEDGMQEIQRLDFGLYRELDHIISSEEDCGEREREREHLLYVNGMRYLCVVSEVK